MSGFLLFLTVVLQPSGETCAISFSREPAGRRTSHSVRICSRQRSNPSEFDFYLQTTQPNRSFHASSGSCPGTHSKLVELEELTMPMPDVPNVGREVELITLDGAQFRLSIDGLYGQLGAWIALESNHGTPLANWIDAMLGVLEPCWRPA